MQLCVYNVCRTTIVSKHKIEQQERMREKQPFYAVHCITSASMMHHNNNVVIQRLMNVSCCLKFLYQFFPTRSIALFRLMMHLANIFIQFQMQPPVSCFSSPIIYYFLCRVCFCPDMCVSDCVVYTFFYVLHVA